MRLEAFLDVRAFASADLGGMFLCHKRNCFLPAKALDSSILVHLRVWPAYQHPVTAWARHVRARARPKFAADFAVQASLAAEQDEANSVGVDLQKSAPLTGAAQVCGYEKVAPFEKVENGRHWLIVGGWESAEPVNQVYEKSLKAGPPDRRHLSCARHYGI